jgi:hypothetical protein
LGNHKNKNKNKNKKNIEKFQELVERKMKGIYLPPFKEYPFIRDDIQIIIQVIINKI